MKNLKPIVNKIIIPTLVCSAGAALISSLIHEYSVFFHVSITVYFAGFTTWQYRKYFRQSKSLNDSPGIQENK